MARLRKKIGTSGRRLTCNEDLVRDLIRHSPFGALGELFVVMAIRDRAEQIIALPASEGR